MEQMIYGTTAPHIKGRMTTNKIMMYILFALIPAGVYGIYLHGIHAGMLILLTCIFAVGTDFLFRKITKKTTGTIDTRVLLNGLIMSYCLPPAAAWYVGVIAGILCSLIMNLSLHFFQKNVVSPIILTRLLLMWTISQQMSAYVLDGVSMATPLSVLKREETVDTLYMIIGNTGGCIGETSALLLSIGAIFLIAMEIIDFRVSGMYLFSFAAFMAVCGGQGLSSYYLTAHLAGGGFMLALWYITPAFSTLPITKKGRLIYGAVLGIFTGISRLMPGTSENICYAILAANLLVPFIEKMTISRPFGVEKGSL